MCIWPDLSVPLSSFCQQTSRLQQQTHGTQHGMLTPGNCNLATYMYALTGFTWDGIHLADEIAQLDSLCPNATCDSKWCCCELCKPWESLLRAYALNWKVCGPSLKWRQLWCCKHALNLAAGKDNKQKHLVWVFLVEILHRSIQNCSHLQEVLAGVSSSVESLLFIDKKTWILYTLSFSPV